MTIWFTSDQHYGHANIIKYCGRPYSNTQEMELDLIAKFNAVVKPEDVVWHLGDFAMNEDVVPQILPRLLGQHRLVAGNHDKCHSKNKKSTEAVKRYLGYGFKEVVEIAELHPFKLCHIPYGDSRYPGSSIPDTGDWLLCGHIHEQWKLKDKMINVGVDVWGMSPVSLETLVAIKKAGKI